MRERSIPGDGLRWFDGLQFKLGLMFLLLLVALGGASFYASHRLVGEGLDSASFRYETEVSRRLAAQLDGITGSAMNLADSLVILARDGRIPRAVEKAVIEGLATALPADSAIASFGIWPEPASTAPGASRDSLVWTRDASGNWNQRADYNDPDTIPYWREAWYTPARMLTGSRGFWSARYRDPLTKKDVVSYVTPLLGARGFEGAATVTLDLDTLNARFAERTAEDSGYALLTDRDGQVLAMSKAAQTTLGAQLTPGRNIAELGQKIPGFNPLVLAIHSRNSAFLEDSLRSSLYDARQVSQLKDNTRDLARSDADLILAAIWNRASSRKPAAAETLRQLDDPVLGETGYAVLMSMPGTDWQLASVTPTREGQDSARYLIRQALVITLGAVAMILLLAFFVLRGTIVRPLRKMLAQLGSASEMGRLQPATVDQSARNELGVIAHWINERSSQIRELSERLQSSTSQLVVESAERQRAQDAMTRVQERSHLTLTTIDDGVVTLDERGYIEDMNPVAEQLLGVNLRVVRGTPFAQSFQARIGAEIGTILPNPAELALERGSRIEYPDGVFIGGKDFAEREIYLAVAPLRARNGRAMGCVVVLRKLSPRLAGASTATEPAHPVTGLGTRGACESKVRSLLDSARIGVRTHGLLVIEVRSRANEGGVADGDDVQARLAELLASQAGGSDQVFSLPGARFAMTIEQADEAATMARAQALLDSISRMPVELGPTDDRLFASMGVVLIDGALDNAMEGIRRGGVACDASLRTGGGTANLYEAALDEVGGTHDDPIWIQRIRRGLDHNQFHITTQWIAPARSRSAEGQVFEVLVALEDEEGFWASPYKFLPVAERHQLAGEIDRWVIGRVLETIVSTPGLITRLAFCGINLSAMSMADPTFFDYIAEKINAYPQIPVEKLCFELRNDIIGANPQQSRRFCEALHAFGCRVAVDQRNDRGVTNLDQIRHLPIDFLKLDAQQFRKLADDPVEQMLAETSLRLAQLMHQRVVVTQIDEESQATAWRRLGADYLQGFTIAKPSPVPFTAPL